MTTTFNSAVEDDQLIECVGRCMVGRCMVGRCMVGRCMVGCGWRGTVADGYPHGPHCERAVGSEANGVTEPGWTPTQFLVHRHRTPPQGASTQVARTWR